MFENSVEVLVLFEKNRHHWIWFYFPFLEPGYYKDNEFGIRIEDVVVIVPTKTKVATVWLLKAVNHL